MRGARSAAQPWITHEARAAAKEESAALVVEGATPSALVVVTAEAHHARGLSDAGFDADAGPLAVANLAVSPEEAAALLSISRKAFDKHVLPAISSVRVGRQRIIRVATLEAEPAHGAGT